MHYLEGNTLQLITLAHTHTHTCTGCLALGEALMLGANTSLMTLRLDHNVTIGTEGLAQLVKGLRTNHKLSVSDTVVAAYSYMF